MVSGITIDQIQEPAQAMTATRARDLAYILNAEAFADGDPWTFKVEREGDDYYVADYDRDGHRQGRL